MRSSLGRAHRNAIMTYRRATSPGRMRPTFLIIGAQKAGTTSLHQLLAQHPDVGSPTKKEIHYFDHFNQHSLAWYRAHFPRSGRFRHSGESSPYYLFHPCCPARVYAALPDIKLIALLRDPVERAYSHYNHEVAKGAESLDFASALAREDERLAGEEERLRSDPRFRSYALEHYSYVARGLYARQLERWYRYFNRDQVLALASEDLFADTRNTLYRVQSWLGLDKHTPADLSARNTRTYDSLDETMRAELRERFASDAGRLNGLIDARLPWA